MQTIQTLIARALVWTAAVFAPADMAAKLRDAIVPTGGGGPRPVLPK